MNKGTYFQLIILTFLFSSCGQELALKDSAKGLHRKAGNRVPVREVKSKPALLSMSPFALNHPCLNALRGTSVLKSCQIQKPFQTNASGLRPRRLLSLKDLAQSLVSRWPETMKRLVFLAPRRPDLKALVLPQVVILRPATFVAPRF